MSVVFPVFNSLWPMLRLTPVFILGIVDPSSVIYTVTFCTQPIVASRSRLQAAVLIKVQRTVSAVLRVPPESY